MKIRSNVKAGAAINHNQTIKPGFKVKSGVKAGGLTGNHNQSMTHSIKAVRSNANIRLLPAF